MHAMHSNQVGAEYAQPFEPRDGPAAMFLFTLNDFVRGLVDVHHDRVVSFGSDGKDTCKGFIADGVRSVRCQHQFQA